MYTKHEVSMSNPMPGEVCTDANANNARPTKHDSTRLIG